MNGTVKFFNEEKAFGFIAGEDGKEYFVHITGITEGTVLRDNDAVTFDVEQGDRGPKAVNVALASGDAPAASEPEAPAEESSEEQSDDDDQQQAA